MAKRTKNRQPKPADSTSEFLSGVSNQTAESNQDHAPSGASDDSNDLDIARKALRDILADAGASAAAKASAARTLAEMAGAIGKHAAPPARSDKPLSEMTRAELEAELKAAD